MRVTSKSDVFDILYIQYIYGEIIINAYNLNLLLDYLMFVSFVKFV